MTKNLKVRSLPLVFAVTIALASALLIPAPVAAQSGNKVTAAPSVARGGDEASLARGAVPDTTPQQRYQTAIREAGGGLKISLEECRAMASAERKSCETQARSRYEADMAKAKAMLQNPSMRPVDVVGGPIRSTEQVYEIKK